MRVLNEIKSLRSILLEYKLDNKKIGLIPTMGALHEGHMALVSAAQAESDITVCSIYINPAQFDNPADLEKYPQNMEKDLQMLAEIGCDMVFCPDNAVMYQNGNRIKFDFGDLDKMMEGRFRQGHFSGVATVVAKLLNIVQPDYAYFGQKDLQQFTIIERLVESLMFNTELRCIPIKRDKNGLALSSRNLRISAEGQQSALILSESLELAIEELKKGQSIVEIKNKINHRFAASMTELEYFEIVNRATLENITNFSNDIQVAICVAAYVENVRLIDNMLLN